MASNFKMKSAKNIHLSHFLVGAEGVEPLNSTNDNNLIRHRILRPLSFDIFMTTLLGKYKKLKYIFSEGYNMKLKLFYLVFLLYTLNEIILSY
jgi:hypothetical protein